MRGLYAIVDLVSLARAGVDPVAFARAVLTARPAALQVRGKESSAAELLAILRALAPWCRAAGVPLVCNDRPDVAVLGGADYVHLGQDDRAIALVRRLSPGLRVGVSTHTLEQLQTALDTRPDYVAYGPVFATTSKANPDAVVGVAGLRAASELVAKHASGGPRIPLVAIGGIDQERAAEVAPFADCAAVIGALMTGGIGAAPERAASLQSILAKPDTVAPAAAS